jgi:hypothetical protein
MITASQRDHFFDPIPTLLHFQRLNLYRDVCLLPESYEMLKFCETIIYNNALGDPHPLGAMVKNLRLWGERYSTAEMMKMDQPIKSMLPGLTHLKYLELGFVAITRCAFALFGQTPAPFSLTALEIYLEVEEESLIDLILPLFRSLRHLDLCVSYPEDEAIRGMTIASTPPNPPRIPLNPPRRLTTLKINGNFRSSAICNLIASTEATKTGLCGWNMLDGLSFLRNSEVMMELEVEFYDEPEEGDSDKSLLKLTNLTSLTFRVDGPNRGGHYVSNHFFTDYFAPELPLQSLALDVDFSIDFSDLVGAFKSKPASLKTWELYTLGRNNVDLYYFDWVDFHSLRQLLEMCERDGVEVSGSDVSFLERVEKEWLLDDSDDVEA